MQANSIMHGPYMDENGKNPFTVAREARDACNAFSPTTRLLAAYFERRIRELDEEELFSYLGDGNKIAEIGYKKFHVTLPVGDSRHAHVIDKGAMVLMHTRTVYHTELEDLRRFLLGIVRDRFQNIGMHVKIVATPQTVAEYFLQPTGTFFSVYIINKSVTLQHVVQREVDETMMMDFSNSPNAPDPVSAVVGYISQKTRKAAAPRVPVHSNIVPKTSSLENASVYEEHIEPKDVTPPKPLPPVKPQRQRTISVHAAAFSDEKDALVAAAADLNVKDVTLVVETPAAAPSESTVLPVVSEARAPNPRTVEHAPDVSKTEVVEPDFDHPNPRIHDTSPESAGFMPDKTEIKNE